jgi:hypothetical protein
VGALVRDAPEAVHLRRRALSSGCATTLIKRKIIYIKM